MSTALVPVPLALEPIPLPRTLSWPVRKRVYYTPGTAPRRGRGQVDVLAYPCNTPGAVCDCGDVATMLVLERDSGAPWKDVTRAKMCQAHAEYSVAHRVLYRYHVGHTTKGTPRVETPSPLTTEQKVARANGYGDAYQPPATLPKSMVLHYHVVSVPTIPAEREELCQRAEFFDVPTEGADGEDVCGEVAEHVAYAIVRSGWKSEQYTFRLCPACARLAMEREGQGVRA